MKRLIICLSVYLIGTTFGFSIKGAFDSAVKSVKEVAEDAASVVSNVNGTTFNTFKAVLNTASTCVGDGKAGWTDPDLGNFTVGPNSPYCNSACSRNFFCCEPQKPEELTVNFFFSRSKDEWHELRINDSDSKKFIKDRDCRTIVWIVHGLGNDINVDGIYNDTSQAFLERNDDKYCTVVVDWHKGNRLYNQAMANVRIVGALLGQMMYELNVVNNSICQGFSLGSHVCGEAGSWVKEKNQKIPRCIGVDPAGPGYDGCSHHIRLDKNDCGVVTSIHTSQFKGLTSIVTEEGLGTKEKSGNCDFWANAGKEQPKCDNATIGSFGELLVTGQFSQLSSDVGYSLACSHSRGMQYFLEQVRQTCQFKGKRAVCGGGQDCSKDSKSVKDEDETSAKLGVQIPSQMTLPPDDECNEFMDVDYTFDTTGKAPFC